jgi:ribokinase
MNFDIVVVGSINMDMVVKVQRRPAKGETLLGTDFFMSPGGKGANQAYAAAKLGASVAMIGQVGDDLFADQLIGNLRAAGAETRYIAKAQGMSSGVALISVDGEGDNSIIVAPGANQRMTPAFVRQYEAIIASAKLLMVQLEIPLEAVVEAVSCAHRHRVSVLLDPAPAQPLPESLLRMVDYILPNEHEIAQLTGVMVTDAQSAQIAGKVLRDKGVETVLAKLGEQGVTVISGKQTFVVPGIPVKAVDTTAAGDAFAGAFAKALAAGRDLPAAVRFANAVGAITVTRQGAQSSMPDMAEAEAFIKEGGLS